MTQTKADQYTQPTKRQSKEQHRAGKMQVAEKDTWAHTPLRCSHETIAKIRTSRHNDGLEECMIEIEAAQGGCFVTADLIGWRWLERTTIREIANLRRDVKTEKAAPMS